MKYKEENLILFFAKDIFNKLHLIGMKSTVSLSTLSNMAVEHFMSN